MIRKALNSGARGYVLKRDAGKGACRSRTRGDPGRRLRLRRMLGLFSKSRGVLLSTMRRDLDEVDAGGRKKSRGDHLDLPDRPFDRSPFWPLLSSVARVAPAGPLMPRGWGRSDEGESSGLELILRRVGYGFAPRRS